MPPCSTRLAQRTPFQERRAPWVTSVAPGRAQSRSRPSRWTAWTRRRPKCCSKGPRRTGCTFLEPVEGGVEPRRTKSAGSVDITVGAARMQLLNAYCKVRYPGQTTAVDLRKTVQCVMKLFRTAQPTRSEGGGEGEAGRSGASLHERHVAELRQKGDGVCKSFVLRNCLFLRDHD